MSTFYYRTSIGQKEIVALQNLERIAVLNNAKVEDIEKCTEIVKKIENIGMLNMQVMWIAYNLYTKSNGEIIKVDSLYLAENELEINSLTSVLLPLKVREKRESQSDIWHKTMSVRIQSEMLVYCKLIDKVI